ncbi:MAG: hypothetical protein J6Z00_04865 [Clostridia bacterium]|nr:hypothetical protein [Clostridia bacterium]
MKKLGKLFLITALLCTLLLSFSLCYLAAADTDDTTSESQEITVSLSEEDAKAIAGVLGGGLLLIAGIFVGGLVIFIVIIVVIVKLLKKGGNKNKNMGPFTTPEVQVKIATQEERKAEKAPIDPVNNVTENKGIPANIPQSAAAYADQRKDSPEDHMIPDMGTMPTEPESQIPDLGTSSPAPEATAIPSMETPAPAPAPAPVTPAPAAPQGAPGVCPQCGAPLTVRTATNGPLAGKQLAVCTTYPTCKYMTEVK